MSAARPAAAAFLLAAGLASCGGGGDHRAGAPRPSPRELDFTGRPSAITPAQAVRVTTMKLTRRIPPRVGRACAAAPFRCPREVPPGGVSPIPDTSGPLETARNFYVLSFNNGTIRGHTHWIVGAGTSAAVSRNLIDDRDHEVRGLPRRIRLLSLRGTRIAVYTWPGNSSGGYLSGHTAAFADEGRRVIFATVHGHAHADADVALVAGMISGP